jgi:hypothetical protein
MPEKNAQLWATYNELFRRVSAIAWSGRPAGHHPLQAGGRGVVMTATASSETKPETVKACPYWCRDRGQARHSRDGDGLVHTSRSKEIALSLHPNGIRPGDDRPSICVWLEQDEGCALNVEMRVLPDDRARMSAGQAAQLASAIIMLVGDATRGEI